MKSPAIAAALLAASAMLAAGGLLLGVAAGMAQTAPAHVAFQIATGTSGGSYFPVGQAIAGLISHPPGVDRCETANVCGPGGLIISARTTDGDVDNLTEVNQGAVDSGFAQADTILDAVHGAGPFTKSGKLTHLRSIAALFTEPVYLVASVKSGIKDVGGLRDKRVSLGPEGSGANVTATEILHAWGLSEWRVHGVHESADDAAKLIADGKLDALFGVGVPHPEIQDLIGRGQARLIPISGDGRTRLLKESGGLNAAVIPAGTYPRTGAIDSVATRAIWVVRDSAPDALVYGITSALLNPANRPALAASYPSAREIAIDNASVDLPAPLHSGAARYYRAQGKSPKTN